MSYIEGNRIYILYPPWKQIAPLVETIPSNPYFVLQKIGLSGMGGAGLGGAGRVWAALGRSGLNEAGLGGARQAGLGGARWVWAALGGSGRGNDPDLELTEPPPDVGN
ncbi:hypothetical protein L3X38_030378 [Prunus dulcis]|uniref:Uncharacterized protein n=1 Tax=Prunus dulcis TaxID=3755 RepID=A0AAD4YT03_PRUDU|nr:hypothetical protein L3X38_030378 [Prunus dulcis]